MQIASLLVEKININNGSVSRLYVGPDGFSFLYQFPSVNKTIIL